MKIQLTRKNDALHFEAENAGGNTVSIDGAPAVGGENKGMRPMELLLTSVAACASFDVVTILQKQREPLEDIQIHAEGKRQTEGDVKPFRKIQLHFRLVGQLNPQKAERAVRLAVEKYCSVAASLDPAIELTYQLTLEPR